MPVAKNGSKIVSAIAIDPSRGSIPYLYILGGYTKGRSESYTDIKFDI
jgi:hypothetical protein